MAKKGEVVADVAPEQLNEPAAEALVTQQAIPEQHPRVGRIVHFGSPIAPAMITSVGELGVVGLTVFPDGAAPFTQKDVPYFTAPQALSWTWPQK